jgi:hypothetical protein
VDYLPHADGFDRSKQRSKEGPIGCDFIIWNMSDKDAQVQFLQGLLMLEPAINRYEHIEGFLCERQERTVLGATPTRFWHCPYLVVRKSCPEAGIHAFV